MSASPWLLVQFALMWIGIPVAIFVFARRLFRVLEGRSARAEEIQELKERVRHLESRVDDIDTATEEIKTSERFTRDLLAARVTLPATAARERPDDAASTGTDRP